MKRLIFRLFLVRFGDEKGFVKIFDMLIQRGLDCRSSYNFRWLKFLHFEYFKISSIDIKNVRSAILINILISIGKLCIFVIN